MHQFVLVTAADPLRPGLCYKVELPNWALETWYTENKIRIAAHHRSFVSEKGNTTITWIDEQNNVQVKLYEFEWSEIQTLLAQADDFKDNPFEGQRLGRPEKRVLVMTTSKERRTGSLVARSQY